MQPQLIRVGWQILECGGLTPLCSATRLKSAVEPAHSKLVPLNQQRDAHSAANAQRREPSFRVS
ncbi:MAG TPA: hypothetical protein VEL78_04760, partial [Pyrinomonadaceae bacterium]|nr:hypothetical protein [Pyrinomonadaceae bacterium]